MTSNASPSPRPDPVLAGGASSSAWQALLGLARPQPPGRMLVLAPGPRGRALFLDQPADPAWKPLVFLDSAREKLLLARTRHRAAILAARATRFPFRRHTFASIVSLEALFSVRPPWTVLAEFHRILVPDGLLLLLEPASHGLFSALRDLLIGPGKRIYAAAELRERLTRCDFTIEAARTLPPSTELPFPAHLFAARKIEHPAAPRPRLQTTAELLRSRQANREAQ